MESENLSPDLLWKSPSPNYVQGPWSMPRIVGVLSGLNLDLLAGTLGEVAPISEIKWVRSP